MAEREQKCYICWHNSDKRSVAVAVCNELKKPVCAEHKRWCEEEQHGTSPLSKECA